MNENNIIKKEENDTQKIVKRNIIIKHISERNNYLPTDKKIKIVKVLLKDKSCKKCNKIIKEVNINFKKKENFNIR
jgi:K+/H+ antiporter YhaU regulatory subunit KhtT